MVDETQSDEPVPISRPTLRRLPDQGWIAGVCAGIADALGVPAWTIRAATILLSFTGFGIVAYILAALLMRDPNGARVIDRRGTKELVLYAAVAIVGWITLPEMIFGNELQGRASVLGSMFPWLLLVGGLALVLRTGPGDRSATSMSKVAPQTLASPAEPASPQEPAPAAIPTATVAAPGIATTAPKGPDAQPIGSGLRWVGQHFPVLGPIVFLATLALAALIIGLGAPVGVVGGLGIAALGVAMLVASKLGRARGLVIPAAILTLLATPTVLAGVRLQTIGAPQYVRATATTAPSDIHAISNGTTVVDLLDLKVSGNIERTYEVAEGRVVVVLPAHMRTIVAADVSDLGGDILVNRPITSELLDMIGPKNQEAALKQIRKNRLADREAVSKFAEQIEELRYNVPGETGVLGGLLTATVYSGWTRHQRATYDPARRAAMDAGQPATRSAGTLSLNLRAGRGELTLVEPIWSDPPTVPEGKPMQSCAEAGGAVGTVDSCSAIERDRRVPTCLLEPVPLGYTDFAANWYEPGEGKRQEDLIASLSNSVGDCREIARTKSADGITPRVVLLACSDGAVYMGCTGLGIPNDTAISVVETPVMLDGTGQMVPASTIPPVQDPVANPSTSAVATVPPVTTAPAAPQPTTTTPTTTPITTAQGAN